VVAAWLSETTKKPPWNQVAIYSSTTKALWHQWSRFCLRKGVLYRKFWSGDGLSTSLQLVAPYQYRMEFIRLAHENMMEGYLGQRRAEAQVQRRGYWSGWPGDVCRFSTHLPAVHAVPLWSTATSRSVEADACRTAIREFPSTSLVFFPVL